MGVLVGLRSDRVHKEEEGVCPRPKRTDPSKVWTELRMFLRWLEGVKKARMGRLSGRDRYSMLSRLPQIWVNTKTVTTELHIK